MEVEDGASNADKTECAAGVHCLKREVLVNGLAVADGNDVAEGVQCLKDEDLSNGAAIVDGINVADVVQCLKSEVLDNGVTIANGVDVAQGVRCLKSGYLSSNNAVAIADGTNAAEEVQSLKCDVLDNGEKIAEGNDVAEGVQRLKSENLINEMADAEGINVIERVQCLQSESVNYGAAAANVNGVAEGVFCLNSDALNNETTVADQNDVAKGIHCLKSEAVNKEVAVADGNDVTKGIHCLKSEAVNKEVAVADGNDVTEGVLCLTSEAVNSQLAISNGNDIAEGSSCGVDGLRTYKRRKHLKLISESKVQDDCRTCVEAASHLADQDTEKIDKDGRDCSSQSGRMYHRSQIEALGHADVMINGCSGQSNGQGVTEMCERAFSDILASEKFSLLHKVLNENFSGRKAESVLDFSVLNSRIEEGAYEQSPSLFLSDIQQVWRNLEDVGNEIVSLAKSLSSLSRASYYEQVGVSVHSAFEDEKQEFCNRDSCPHTKSEQAEDSGMPKIYTCRHCGGKTAGTDCLVCDSCEETYHISCLEPAAKKVPTQSWYCASCTASGIASPHENCVVCERLDIPETIVGDESCPANEDTLFELEENSYCTYERIQVSRNGEILCVCKICGNEVDDDNLKICGHAFCDKKYYHIQCLTSKQLKSYGPCWYCPSCICRVCLTDRDDDQIVLCDGCDHAYHIYCMEPPRTSIPKGKWFCRKCDAGIQAIRQAKKLYESYKQRKTGQDSARLPKTIEKNWKNKRRREVDKGEGMDMLLTAAQKLNCEEKLAAIQIESQRT